MKPSSTNRNTEYLVYALRDSLGKLEAALSKVDEPILIFDEDNKLEWCNEAFENLAQKTRITLIGSTVSDCFSPFTNPHTHQAKRREDTLRKLLSLNEETFNIDLYQQTTQRKYECEIKRVDQRAGSKIVVLKSIDSQAIIDALTDTIESCPLTGLLNRRGLKTYLTKLFKRQDHLNAGLIFFDLNKFKEVNDCYGHEIGDKALIHFAKQLSTCTRRCDVVSRLSGDEFVVVVNTTSKDRVKESIESIVSRLTKLCQIPLHVQQEDKELVIWIKASAGASLGYWANSPEELLIQADQAMYRSKERSSSIHYYGKELEVTRKQNKLIRDSADAIIQQGHVPFHLQPIIDLRKKECIGYEALMRPRSESGLILPPHRFVEHFESSNNIKPIDEIVFHSVLNDRATQSLIKKNSRLSLNLSAVTLRTRGAARAILKVIDDAKWIKTSQIIVEITETGFIQNLNPLSSAVMQLAAAGLTIVLDDFGSGFTGFTQLIELPINGFKIDQQLFHDSFTESKPASVLQAMALIAEKTNLKVIVEGIENEYHQQHMLSLGFHYAQGFDLGLPMPPEYYLDPNGNHLRYGLECQLDKQKNNPFNPNFLTISQ